MKVTKEDLQRIVDEIDGIIATMENYNVDEISTTCNTYGMNGTFLGLGYRGYLELDWEKIEEDIIERSREESEEEE